MGVWNEASLPGVNQGFHAPSCKWIGWELEILGELPIHLSESNYVDAQSFLLALPNIAAPTEAMKLTPKQAPQTTMSTRTRQLTENS